MEVDAKLPGGGRVGSMRTPADKGDVSKVENLTDILCGWPITLKYQLLNNEASAITIFTSIINCINETIYNRIVIDPNCSGDEW